MRRKTDSCCSLHNRTFRGTASGGRRSIQEGSKFFVLPIMSLGINLLMQLLKEATKVLSPAGYDIEIVEKHHNQKLDAPSGTAIALADSINEAADGQYEYVYDRSQVRKKRDKKELGISACAEVQLLGNTKVLFAGNR